MWAVDVQVVIDADLDRVPLPAQPELKIHTDRGGEIKKESRKENVGKPPGLQIMNSFHYPLNGYFNLWSLVDSARFARQPGSK